MSAAGAAGAGPEAAEAPGRPRPRGRRDEARTRVLRSALGLAERTAFHDITVEQIAAAVGISRSAFYLHFRDKQDLLLAALEELSGELRQTAERWWLRDGAPEERVRVAVASIVSLYAEHAGLFRAATEVAAYDSDVREEWLRIVNRFVERARERIAAEQREGVIAESLDAPAAAEALVWMVERCCAIYLGGERGRSPEELVEQLTSVWAAALYPGVIPARELRPDAPSGPIWGIPAPDFRASDAPRRK